MPFDPVRARSLIALALPAMPDQEAERATTEILEYLAVTDMLATRERDVLLAVHALRRGAFELGQHARMRGLYRHPNSEDVEMTATEWLHMLATMVNEERVREFGRHA